MTLGLCLVSHDVKQLFLQIIYGFIMFRCFSVYVFFMAYLHFVSSHSRLADTIDAFGNVLVHSLRRC